MKESLAHLLNTLSKVLAEDVLSELNVRSWEASRVRSVLMLLQYCEDRVLHERSVLEKGNRLMTTFFEIVLSDFLSSQLGPTAKSLLVEIAEAVDYRGRYASTDPEAASEARKSLLCRLIRAAGRDRLEYRVSDAEFRRRLHSLLKDIHETEHTLFAKSALLLPM
jgi:hypothetical protein